jgi:hypothetical protein
MHSQTRESLNCDGLTELPIKISVVLNAHAQKEFIKKRELLTYDFHLVLSDTTFKIIAFVAGYDRHSASLLDVNSRTYLGNTIEAGDPFITHIWLGDLLVIDCINVEKNGKRYLLKPLQFKIY